MLINALTGANRPEQFDFWQGYAKALRDLSNGLGDKLAAKDAALQGYQLPGVLQAAANCLGNDLYGLPRVAVVERLAQAGIELPADAVADADVVPVNQLKNAAVASGELDSKHAPAVVDGDDGSGVHAASVADEITHGTDGGAL